MTFVKTKRKDTGPAVAADGQGVLKPFVTTTLAEIEFRNIVVRLKI